MSGVYTTPIATLAGGLPYNIVTGTNNSGDIGDTTDRPVIHGVVIPRNAGPRPADLRVGAVC